MKLQFVNGNVKVIVIEIMIGIVTLIVIEISIVNVIEFVIVVVKGGGWLRECEMCENGKAEPGG